jgi:F-type H+-transporting ATPase subunit b
MENLLTPEKGLIIWTIVTFIVLVFILGKVAWKPLLTALRDREEGIRKAIEDAMSARQSADQLKLQYEKELASSQEKAYAILKQTEAEAQKLREKILKEAEEESLKIMANAKSQIEEEKTNALRDLRTQVSKISIQAAEKLMKHSMNQRVQDELLEEFFKDMGK